MNTQQLWNDRTFFTLLNDVFKARKDAELGPVRLEVMLEYVRRQGAQDGLIHAQVAIKPAQTAKVELTDEDRRIAEEEIKLGVVDQEAAKLKQLEEVSQIILKSIKQDGWDVAGNRTILISSKRNFDHNFLQDYLKQKHGLQFSQLTIGLSPHQVGTNHNGIDGKSSQAWSLTLSK